MKLVQLQILNYRSIDNLVLHFPTFYSAICGKNNSGKTNVLRALRTIFDDASVFDREFSLSFKEDLPKWGGKEKEKDRKIEITLSFEVDPEKDAGLYRFLTTYLKLEVSGSPLAVELSNVATLESPDGQIGVTVAGTMIDRIEAQDVLQKITSSDVILFHNSTERGFPFFLQGRRQFPTELSLGDSNQLDEAKQKLNNTVNRIAKKHQREVEELLGRLQEKYKVGFSFPKFDPSRVPFSVTLGDAQMSVPLESWGSGTQNRTHILLTIFKARQVSQGEDSATKITPVLVIEEPESFLHPSAQAEFGKILQDMAEEFGVQVIVTTHSPYMLSQAAPTSNVLLHRHYERQKVRDTRHIDTSGDKWMEPFGLALGIDNDEFLPWRKALFSEHKKLLLVEGDTDKEYFELLRSAQHGTKALKFDGDIVAYGGKEAIKQRFLLNFIKMRNEKCFVTFDLDVKGEVEPTLRAMGFSNQTEYLPVGIDEPGRKAIEGLVPDSVRGTVYAANTQLVDQAMNGAGSKEKNDARNALKKLILEQFKKVATPGDEHYKHFYALARSIDKALA